MQVYVTVLLRHDNSTARFLQQDENAKKKQEHFKEKCK